MATPFLQHFYVAQQLVLDLQKEVHTLERYGMTYIQQLNANDLQYINDMDDPEMNVGQNFNQNNQNDENFTSQTSPQQNSTTRNQLIPLLTTISTLLQRARHAIYTCENNISNNNGHVERAKIQLLHSQCNDAEGLVHRCKQRIYEKKRQLEMDSYLFNSSNGGNNSFGQRHGGGGGGGKGENDGLLGNNNNNNDGIDKVGFYTKEQDSLQNALKTMHNTLNNAYSSINSLERQRELFENIQRKTAEVAEQLGFSRQVIGWISRQENTNTIITFIGMVITLTIVITFYYYWTHRK